MRRLALITFLTCTLYTQADILHLQDGSRHYGTLISQNEREVVFRIQLDAAGSYAIKRYPRTLVKSITPGGRPPESQPAYLDNDDSDPAGEDFEQMLRESFELLDDRDIPAALMALQRTVVRAPPEKLPELEEQCRQARGRGLAELLAETRLAVGLAGDGFQVKYVTPYEAAPFASLLEIRQAELLKKIYSERSIQAWTDTPKDYVELQPNTRTLVVDARRVAGMIGVRVRFDPRLKDDRAERQRLIKLRAAVARLVAHVTALRGYTEQSGDHDIPDPMKDIAEQLCATSQPTSADNSDAPPP